MTLSYSQAKKVYQGDGTTTRWEIGFPFLQVQDLQIIRVAADGTETVLDGDFTVDTQLNEVCYPMSGSQTLPLAQGEKLILRRRTPLTQQMAFDVQQALDPSVLEAGYDKAAMIAQELAEELSRTVRFPLSSAGAHTDAQGYLNTLSQTQQAAVQANSSALQALAKAQQAWTQLQTLAAQAASSAQLAQGKASEASTSAQEASDDASAAAASAQTAAQHAQSISAHLQNTDNPHAVSKAQVGLGNVDNTADMDKPVSTATQAALDLKADAAEVNAALDLKADSAEVEEEVADINAALARKEDDDEFHPEDYNWPDIRPAARPNAIVLMAGVKADYSAYDHLGFVATCEGGYNVFIDGVQYGETYASDAQCSITWSQYSATAGFPVTYPEALTAHIVQIVPAGKNDITAFRGARIAASGEENQGRLWIHFNLTNTISLQYLCARYNNFKNPLFVAITSNSKFIKVSNIEFMLGETTDLHASYSPCEFLPGFDLSESQSVMAAGAFNTNGVSVIRLKNGILPELNSAFANNTHLKKIELDNVTLSTNIGGFPYYDISNIFKNCEKLKKLPPIDMSGCYQFDNFITNCQSLKDFILDWGYANLLKHISFGGNSSAPIWALTGLLLSPCAPFDGTSPQIDVSYTGLDQNALASLFKSLPYNVGYSVTGSPTIQDGIVTNADSANSVMLPMFDFFSAESFDYVVKLKTGGSGGPNGTFTSFPMENTETDAKAMYGIYKYGDTLSLYGGFDAENNLIQTSIPFTANSALYVRWQKTSGHFKSSYSFDGSDWTTASDTTSTVMKNHTAIRITPDFSWTGSAVDLNGTYITVNGVPYFRGTAAMDKTINITGATGAAALTAEQLAIATDKGWTVTR